jgi:hypothetical protein
VLLENTIRVTTYFEKGGCKVYGTTGTYHIKPERIFGVVEKTE